MRPYELAQRLRSDYAAHGKTVYDRLDRWRDEHDSCCGGHVSWMEGSIVVESCPSTGSVVVINQDWITGSKCTQCGRKLMAEEIELYLALDHLCGNCVGLTESD